MGHFKVDRSIIDHAVFAHPIALKIWIWCLSKASWKKRSVPLKIGKGEIIVDIKPGQFIFGRFKAEESLNIDGSAIYRWIQKFSSEEWQLIELEPNNQYTLVTICNWDKYQILNEDDEQPMNNGRTTGEQPKNTYKKVKTVKESIVNTILPYDSMKFTSAWVTLIKEPNWKKKTTNALNISLKKLSEYDEATAIKMIEKAIECNWAGIYPLNNIGKQTTEQPKSLQKAIRL